MRVSHLTNKILIREIRYEGKKQTVDKQKQINKL